MTRERAHDLGDWFDVVPLPSLRVAFVVADVVGHGLEAATAGHPPPALLPPGDEPAFVGLVPGPPLGVGGMPFEVTEFEVQPGSMPAFFMDGLVESRGGDIDEGTDRLRSALAGAIPPTPAVPSRACVAHGRRTKAAVASSSWPSSGPVGAAGSPVPGRPSARSSP